MSDANAIAEVAMLINSPDEVSEDPDFTALAQVTLDSFVTAAKAMIQMKPQLPQVNVKTICTAPAQVRSFAPSSSISRLRP